MPPPTLNSEEPENPPGGDEGQSIGGSSPLTRGNHNEDSPRVFDVRLIPAHAGKTPET